MDEIRISDKISYLPASDNPLSADVGIVREDGAVWLFDVGCGEESLFEPACGCRVVLSHFHRDHAGNLFKLRPEALYVSKATRSYVHAGTVVTGEMTFGGIRIFPLPSTHAPGCLGLEVDGTYAFVGDALYAAVKKGIYAYNAQLLKGEIEVLKRLQAPFLLVSHFPGLIRRREDAILELEAIYAMRSKNEPYIPVPMEK